VSLTIDLHKALARRDQGALFVDVRTPAEFAEATIPGAVNVPIFSDEERARVGTLYKQQGKEAARKLGVELVSPRIPALIEQVERALGAQRRLVVVFCWRGGMRSKAVTSFLDLAGIPARQLLGGHKAFRGQVLEFFEREPWGRVLVLRGMTGVGKTKQLKRLAAQGYPVVDLEGLANHRGSAFGALGLGVQPRQKMFEALLFDELRRHLDRGWVLTEGESRYIGRLLVPPSFFAAMQQETSLWVDVSLEGRVRNILEDYPAKEELRELFVNPIRNLKERLGAERVEAMLALLQEGNWQELVRELMEGYYDPLYRHTLPERRIEVCLDGPEAELRLKEAIEALLSRQPCAMAAPEAGTTP